MARVDAPDAEPVREDSDIEDDLAFGILLGAVSATPEGQDEADKEACGKAAGSSMEPAREATVCTPEARNSSVPGGDTGTVPVSPPVRPNVDEGDAKVAAAEHDQAKRDDLPVDSGARTKLATGCDRVPVKERRRASFKNDIAEVVPSAAAVKSYASKPGAESRRTPAMIVGRGNRIPAEILENADLNNAIAVGLPSNHNFEVHKTVWRLQRSGCRHVALQMPEGLQMWATTLADICKRFAPGVEAVTILGDVTFGACCIDDLGARALGCDMLVHYGHSCIVPTDQTTVTTLYVHVEVDVDIDHLVATVRHNFSASTRVNLMGSVQFSSALAKARTVLLMGGKDGEEEDDKDGSSYRVPRVRPLGSGETLGCTSPIVEDCDAIVFVCDGRFHLESAMIQNPHVKAFYRYDPKMKTLTRESFGYEEMHTSRRTAIEAARQANFVGLILGTLGRQGSSGVLEGVERLLEKKGVPVFTVLLSEVSPERLALFEGVGAWVQVACPRLSLDWGDSYKAPLLTPYEAHVVWGETAYQNAYPMDYYSNKGGPWSNYGAHNGYGGSIDTKFQHLR